MSRFFTIRSPLMLLYGKKLSIFMRTSAGSSTKSSSLVWADVTEDDPTEEGARLAAVTMEEGTAKTESSSLVQPEEAAEVASTGVVASSLPVSSCEGVPG